MTSDDILVGDATMAERAARAAANTVTRTVAASPTQVFDVISQGWLYPVWVVGAARMRDVDAAWSRPGSKLHHSFGLWPALLDDETVVVASSPPARIVLQARGWPAGEATVDIRITPDGDGRCVVALGEDASHGPGRLIPGPLRRSAIQVRNRESLRRLAFIAEGMAGTAASPPSP